MSLVIPKRDLEKLAEQTQHVCLPEKKKRFTSQFSSCGNSCYGTCDGSPCTNEYAATHR